MNNKLRSEDILLHVAAVNGDFTTLARLLAEGTDPAVRDRAGNTALHHCPFCRPCIKLFVEYGLDVNSRNQYKQTPLHIFVSSVLLEFGADMNLQDYEGRTPLHINVHRNWAGVAQLLIAHGADLEIRDKWGRTPLHQAAIARSSESLLMLIAYGANLDTRDNQGRTPLESIEAGEYEGVVADCDAVGLYYIVRMLHQASNKEDVRDEYEDTALISAAQQDVVEAMPFLLQQGADLWAVSDNGMNALQHALIKEQPAAALFLRHAMPLDGIWNAVATGEISAVVSALEAGFDANSRDAQQQTPLMLASIYGQTEMAHLLLAHGASPDASDMGGFTALMLTDNLEIASLLIDNAADVNMPSRVYWTPLLTAIHF